LRWSRRRENVGNWWGAPGEGGRRGCVRDCALERGARLGEGGHVGSAEGLSSSGGLKSLPSSPLPPFSRLPPMGRPTGGLTRLDPAGGPGLAAPAPLAVDPCFVWVNPCRRSRGQVGMRTSLHESGGGGGGAPGEAPPRVLFPHRVRYSNVFFRLAVSKATQGRHPTLPCYKI